MALYIVGPLSDLTYLVTERSVPDEALAPYRALGITFVRKGNLSTKKETLEWRCQRHHCFEFSEECMPLRLSQVPEHLALCLLPVR